MKIDSKTALEALKIAVTLIFGAGVAWATVTGKVKDTKDKIDSAIVVNERQDEHLARHDVENAEFRVMLGYISDGIEDLRQERGLPPRRRGAHR